MSMYDVFPDLLKFYYTTLLVMFMIGGIIGFGICHAWRSKDDGGQRTQGAAYDACLEEDDDESLAVRKAAVREAERILKEKP